MMLQANNLEVSGAAKTIRSLRSQTTGGHSFQREPRCCCSDLAALSLSARGLTRGLPPCRSLPAAGLNCPRGGMGFGRTKQVIAHRIRAGGRGTAPSAGPPKSAMPSACCRPHFSRSRPQTCSAAAHPSPADSNPHCQYKTMHVACDSAWQWSEQLCMVARRIQQNEFGPQAMRGCGSC